MVAIATPCLDQVNAGYTASLAFMISHTLSSDTSLALCYMPYTSSVLPVSRTWLAMQAVRIGADHILWIDSDMVFPKDIIQILIEHQKPIVAANCLARSAPFRTNSRTHDLEQIYTDPDSHGLQQVDLIGFGVCWTDTWVFEKIKKPWFPITYDGEADLYYGEDFGFAKQCDEAGIPRYIDHDLSRSIQHIGQQPFNVMHARELQGMCADMPGLT